MKNMKFWRTALVATLVLTVMLSVTGGTIAWFTDTVTTADNNIQAGTLKVALSYKNDDKEWVDASTGAIFDYDKWEPGFTQVREVELKNVGTLAFKYRLNLKPNAQPAAGEANLADVIDVYVGYDMEKVPAAKADLANGKKVGTISELMKLETGVASSVMQAGGSGKMWIALHMQEEAGNEYQGLSVGEGFSLVLEAAQLAFEGDSFGIDYDEDATYGSDIWTGETDNSWNTDENGAAIESNEFVITTAEQLADFAAQVNAGNSFAGKVIKLANNIDLNNANWEPIGSNGKYFDGTFDGQNYTVSNYKVNVKNQAGLFGNVRGTIKNVTVMNANIQGGDYAGALLGQGYARIDNCHAKNVTVTTTPFLLADGVTYDGGAKAGGLVGQMCEGYMYIKNSTATNVNIAGYRDIGGIAGMLHYNNTIENCSASDVNLTYLVVDNYADGKKNENAGNVYGRNGQKAGSPVTIINISENTPSEITYKVGAGSYKLSTFAQYAKMNFIGESKAAVIDNTLGAYMENSTVSFEGVTIKGSTGYANGASGGDYAALYTPNVTYTNCTFDGPFRIGRDGATFIKCDFTNLGNDYVWTYGNDCTFIGCTFESDGKALLIYSDGGSEVSEVKVENCVFNATQSAYAGAISNQPCAAIEIQNYGNGVNLTTNGNTIDSDFSGEWRIKTYHANNPAVIVNGTEYTSIALDGKTMTINGTEVTVNGN